MNNMDDDLETIVPESEYGNSSTYSESPAIFQGLKKLFYLPSQAKEIVSPVIPVQGLKLMRSQSDNGDASETESISLLSRSAHPTQKKRNLSANTFSIPYNHSPTIDKNNQNRDVAMHKQVPDSQDYSQTQPPEHGYEVRANKWERPPQEGKIKGRDDQEEDNLSIVSDSTHMSEPLIPLVDGRRTLDRKDKKIDSVESNATSGHIQTSHLSFPPDQMVVLRSGLQHLALPTSYYEPLEEVIPETQMSEPLIPVVTKPALKKEILASKLEVPLPLERYKQNTNFTMEKQSSVTSGRKSSSQNNLPWRRDDMTNVDGQSQSNKKESQWKKSDTAAVQQKHCVDMDTLNDIEKKEAKALAKLQRDNLSKEKCAQLQKDASNSLTTLTRIGRHNREEKEEITQIIKGGSATKYNKVALKQRLGLLTLRQKKLMQVMNNHKQLVSKIGQVQPSHGQHHLLSIDSGEQKIPSNAEAEIKTFSQRSKSLGSTSSSQKSSLSINSKSVSSQKSRGSLLSMDEKANLLQKAGINVTSPIAFVEPRKNQQSQVPRNKQMPQVQISKSEALTSTSPAKIPLTWTISTTLSQKEAPLSKDHVTQTQRQSDFSGNKSLNLLSNKTQGEIVKDKGPKTIKSASKANMANGFTMSGRTGEPMPKCHKQSDIVCDLKLPTPQTITSQNLNIKVPPVPTKSGLLGPGNRLLINTSKMRPVQVGIGAPINQTDSVMPVATETSAAKTKIIYISVPPPVIKSSEPPILKHTPTKPATVEQAVLTTKPPTGKQSVSTFQRPTYRFPGVHKIPQALSISSIASSTVSRKRPRSYKVGLHNSPQKFAKEKKKAKKKDCKLKLLVEQGILTPGQDVLSIMTETRTFRASLNIDGKIQSSGGEMFLTPMSWCMAILGKLQNAKMAYQKVFYKSRPLDSYLDSLKEVVNRDITEHDEPDVTITSKPPVQREVPPIIQRENKASHLSQQSETVIKMKDSFDLLNLLQNCQIELINDKELVPGDIWAREPFDKGWNWESIDVW